MHMGRNKEESQACTGAPQLNARVGSSRIYRITDILHVILIQRSLSRASHLVGRFRYSEPHHTSVYNWYIIAAECSVLEYLQNTKPYQPSAYLYLVSYSCDIGWSGHLHLVDFLRSCTNTQIAASVNGNCKPDRKYIRNVQSIPILFKALYFIKSSFSEDT